MSEPTAVDDEWRTRGSSLGADSILNEAGVCELLKRLSSFSAPSPSLSPFSPSSDLIFLSRTLLSSLGPSVLLFSSFSLLCWMGAKEGQLYL